MRELHDLCPFFPGVPELLLYGIEDLFFGQGPISVVSSIGSPIFNSLAIEKGAGQSVLCCKLF